MSIWDAGLSTNNPQTVQCINDVQRMSEGFYALPACCVISILVMQKQITEQQREYFI